MYSPTLRSPRPSRSPAPAAARLVFPHDHGPSSANHSTPSNRSASGSPASGRSSRSSGTSSPSPARASPSVTRRRRHTCSACRVATADGEPHGQPSTPTATIDPPVTAAAAQPTPPNSISHGHAREEVMRDADSVADDSDAATGCSDGMDIEDMAQSTSFVPYRRYDLWYARRDGRLTLPDLPNEVLLHILGFLDVCDLLATSRTSHQLRHLSLAPILHQLRLRQTRHILPPLLYSPQRPSLADLIARSIFLTHTTVVSKKLARSLNAIRLARRLAVRPSPEALVERCVLPPECVPGHAKVAPALVAKTRAVERERVKDGLRRWVGSVLERRVKEKGEDRKKFEERVGVGRVWKLRRFWERVSRGEVQAN